MSDDELPKGLMTYKYEATYRCIGCPSCHKDNWRHVSGSWKGEAEGTKCWNCNTIMIHEEMLEFVKEIIDDEDMEEGTTLLDYVDYEDGKKSI